MAELLHWSPFSLLPSLILIVSLCVQPATAQNGYEAYAGLSVRGVTGEGIAGNGANQPEASSMESLRPRAFGVKNRKGPIAPVAPPR